MKYQALLKERADLVDKRTALATEARKAQDAAETAGRGLTEAEQTRDDAIVAELEQIAAQIDDVNRRIKSEEIVREALRNAPVVSGFHDRAEDRPWGHEFRGLPADQARAAAIGEFLIAVAHAGTPGGATDPRLLRAAATGLNTTVPSEGGFLVQTDFSTALLDSGFAQAVLAPRCQRIQIGEGADSIEAPVIDQTSRANGSRWGGVQVYRRAEADTVTATKPKFGEWELRLEDLMAICYATERSLRDALSLGRIMQQAFAEEFAFKVDDEIVRGTGAGECLGVLNAPATVQVSKETGQTAATVVFENIVKMWARLNPRSRANAVWFYNQDAEPQLYALNLAVGTGGLPVFMPPNGLAGSPLATLMGRPMVPIEQAETLGTAGDLMLLDLSQYVLIEKGGIQSAESMHVRFVYAERAFRWMYSINGKPKAKAPLTPFKGTNTQSAFITLQTR